MRKLILILFPLLGGLLVAVHLSHWLLPIKNPLSPVEVKDGWLTTPAQSHRGYFRQTVELPFVPKCAWIAVAADDYILYVNGQVVAHNVHLLIHGDTFQSRMSDRGQSLSYDREFLSLVWEPVLQQVPAQERRMVQYYSIHKLLKPGRNTIAVFAQSNKQNQVAVWGSASIPGAAVEIPGYASAWRASTTSTTRGGSYWYTPSFVDTDWEPAASLENTDESIVYAVQPPEIWTRPFTSKPITVDRSREDQIFQVPIPNGTGAGGDAWVRIWSNRPYDVFVGEAWAGGDYFSTRAMSLDISRFLPERPSFLSVRLHRMTNSKGKVESNDEMPWLFVDGAIDGAPISTSEGWSFLDQYHPDWRQGAGTWQKATVREVSQVPDGIRLIPPNIWERGWFWMLAKLAVVCVFLLTALALLLGTFVPLRREGQFERSRLELGCWLLAPALLGVLAVELVRFVFNSRDSAVYFLLPASDWLLLAGPVLLAATILAVVLPSRMRVPELGQESAFGHGMGYLLAAVCLLAFVLRAHALAFQPPIADEMTSWDAAEGIVRTGVPILRGGVLYTRSPLYHYALAGWFELFGDNLLSARSMSILFGVLVLPAVYYLLYATTGRRRTAALVGTLLLAIDPWMISSTRLIRFYPLMQLCMVMSVILFLKGFIWREGKRYQHWFFVACALGVTSQELFATTFPAFLLAFVACYRPFRWKSDWTILAGFSLMMTVTMLDVFSFSLLCLTPHVAVATQSESLVVLHFSDIKGAVHNMITRIPTSLFYTCNGHSLLLSASFFLGVPYWLRRPRSDVLFLYWSLLVTLASVTVLDIMMSARYTFFLYPIFFVVSFLSAIALVDACGAWLSRAEGRPEFQLRRRWRFLALSALLAAVVANLELPKVLGSYDRLRIADTREALEEVDRRRKPEDIVINTRPQLASPDYLLLGGLGLVGYLQSTPTGITERSTGGKLMWTIDQLRHQLAKSPRAWIVLDDEYQEYLQAGVLDFLMHSCTVEHEYFGGRILMWDRSAGRIPVYPDQEGEADNL